MNEAYISLIEYVFISYALSLAAFYMILLGNASLILIKNRIVSGRDDLQYTIDNNDDAISIISPAYNEENSIIQAVESLMSLDYDHYEVIVVNDGSRDLTLNRLIDHFQLYESNETCYQYLHTLPPKAIYRSNAYNNLRVIDKPNGGKADALNMGVNFSKYPIICGVDADSMLDKSSLTRIVEPLLADSSTIAVGGMVRIMNGSDLDKDGIRHMGLPTNFLSLFQVVEYTRSFLYGRLGWLPFKAILLISGAFGLFRKEILIDVGGYKPDTIGEDMELVVRMHRIMCERNIPYRIEFVSDAICWTECPEDVRSLKNQRVRWQRGLGESLLSNIPLLFTKNGGAAAWIAFPFLLVFELFGPAIELIGIILIMTAFYMGSMSAGIVFSFLFLLLGLSMAISAIAILLDEFHANQRRSLRDIFILFLALILETVIYRQVVNYWRTVGLFNWLSGSKASWGTIKRRSHGPKVNPV
jgi:cellulose synthase/poly-beta-1,6-N-acetylglucosamine synthase-like glycosyltransferase